jgi:hypothetical protein
MRGSLSRSAHENATSQSEPFGESESRCPAVRITLSPGSRGRDALSSLRKMKTDPATTVDAVNDGVYIAARSAQEAIQ